MDQIILTVIVMFFPKYKYFEELISVNLIYKLDIHDPKAIRLFYCQCILDK